MKLSKILILSLGMALCAGAGVGVAVAEFTRTKAENSGTSSFDKVVSLYWGGTSSSVEISDVTGLEPNVAQYRFLELSSDSSSASGTVTVSFELALDTGVSGGSLNGLTVKVYETAETKNESNVAEAISGLSPDITLSSSNLTDDISFSVTTGTNAKHYALAINYDGSYLDGGVIAGLVSISQSFAAL